MPREIIDEGTLEEQNSGGRKPHYTPPPDYDVFPLDDRFQEMLSWASEVVLDPSALPFLPRLLQYVPLGIRVPLVLFQLLSVRRDDVPSVTMAELPEEQQAAELLRLAQRTLRPWLSRRWKIDWDHIRRALESSGCKPIFATKGKALEIQNSARVGPGEEVEASIQGIGTDLAGLLLGQEVAGAAEKEIPIVGTDERPLAKLASRFMSTLTTRGPHSLVDRKQRFFNRIFDGLPKRTRDQRWFIAIVLGVGGFFPPVAIPAGLGGIALTIVDP